MDSLALNLPPEKIVTQVMRYSAQAIHSQQPSERKAGYVALGIIAEGCSDHITSKLVVQNGSPVLPPYLTKLRVLKPQLMT